ncbi:adenylate/guanylate cyclase domain-containing protein [Mesorhizobium sp. KR9-304]|uniref:adenylate/guanylate cyclase domain-containing protein n=1 Tax=Mesorhizobium sp. KR9-304 TaxID=3156614 RepID=UPI0032B316CB
MFRTARLVSGLVMMTFVVMHVANLALNLVSIETADAGLKWLTWPWRSLPGTVLLYGAAAVHVALVLRALYRRRTLKMPAKEAAQILLGLFIPLLIAEHVIGTRVYGAMTGFEIDYEFVVRALWIDQPSVGFKQVVALLVIWAHGCLGLHFWLRYRDSYPAAAPWLLIGAVLVPVLGLLGFADAGKAVQELPLPAAPDEAAQERVWAALAAKDMFLTLAYATALGAVAATLALRGLRQALARRSQIEVRYESGQVVRVPKGSSVLEASRIGGIPHYAVCGGKGRCSTCRIRVTAGVDALPPPNPLERATLSRIHADPSVRLACQLRPTAPVTVLPLLAADRERALPVDAGRARPGREQEIAVLFCDIRGFTALADHRLPYDVVFLLNRYFAIVGKAVEQSGGRLDKFIGDGAMALFGLDSSTAEACRQALAASAFILAELDRLSQELTAELPSPLKVAIGIHAGPAIVGAMGYGGTMHVTAIGDTVNVASRLEAAAKEFNAAIVVSDTVVALSGLDLGDYEVREIAIRGSARPLNVRVVPQGAELAAGFAQTRAAQSAA